MVRTSPRAILAVEKYVVADIVTEKGTLLFHRESELLGIAESAALQFEDMLSIETALTQSLCEKRSNVLIDQRPNRRHQRPGRERTLSSVLAARSRSISS